MKNLHYKKQNKDDWSNPSSDGEEIETIMKAQKTNKIIRKKP